MSEKGIHIHKFQDGNDAVVVEFGFGKIGIGLDKNCALNLAVHLQELKEPKEMGALLTNMGTSLSRRRWLQFWLLDFATM